MIDLPIAEIAHDLRVRPKAPAPNSLSLTDQAIQLLKADAPARPAAATALLLMEQVHDFLAKRDESD